MKIHLTPAVIAEMEETIQDAIKAANPTSEDLTYRKIHAALVSTKLTRRGLLIDLNEDDLREIRSRTETNVGRDGVCQENLQWSSDPADRGYWLGRMRAYTSLQNQLNRLVEA